MLDAYRAHITARVWNAAALFNLWLLVVPAGLTWLLQALDTHGFRSYKNHVCIAHQRHCIRNGGATDSLDALLDAIKDATEECLRGKSWETAFVHNGFGDAQRQVRRNVVVSLGSMDVTTIPSSRPTEEQLRCCLPRGATLYYKAAWRAVDGLHSSGGRAAASSSSVAVAAPSAAALDGVIAASAPSASSSDPIAARTRARLRTATAATIVDATALSH